MLENEPEAEIYFNETLNRNTISLETEPTKPPLRSEVTEFDRLIKAGINNIRYFLQFSL